MQDVEQIMANIFIQHFVNAFIHSCHVCFLRLFTLLTFFLFFLERFLQL